MPSVLPASCPYARNRHNRPFLVDRHPLPPRASARTTATRHQTGTGKTYTMMGPPADRGVNARALGDLFTRSAARRGEVSI